MKGDEIQLQIKTHTTCYQAIEALIQANHPYELPEIIATPITFGEPSFLNWITQSLTEQC